MPEAVRIVREHMAERSGNAPKAPAYAIGMHKGGSTMLQDFFQIYSARSQIRSISISNALFKHGISDDEYTVNNNLVPLTLEKYLYFGFRYVPGFMLANKSRYLNYKGIALARDPRDCVVSAYFSFLKSHVVMSGAETSAAQQIEAERSRHAASSIDEYALSEIGRFTEELCGFAYFAHENVKIYRYEDIIFDKRPFFKEAIEFLGLEWNESSFEAALNRVDVLPDAERPDAHIRNVRPGNYKEKLQPETIARINARYRSVLDLFGYETQDS